MLATGPTRRSGFTTLLNRASPELPSRVTQMADAGIADDLPAAEIISRLRTSFHYAEFDKAANILAARESSAAADLARLTSAKITAEFRCDTLEKERTLLLARVAELEAKINNGGGDLSLTAKIADLERALKEERDGYALLEANHGKLEFKMFDAVDEAVIYKRNGDRLQEQLDRVSDDLEVCRAREEKAQETIDRLLTELARKEAGKFVELRTEIQDLRCGKRRLAEEVETWRVKFSNAEVKALTGIDENLALKAKLEASEKEKGVLMDKLEAAENRTLKVKLEAAEKDEDEVLTLKARIVASEKDKAENLALKARLEAAERDMAEKNLALKTSLKAMENVKDEIAALKAKLEAVEKQKADMLSCRSSSDNCKSKYDKVHPVKLEPGSEKKGARTCTVIDISDSEEDEKMDAESHGFAGKGDGPEKANSCGRYVDVTDDEDNFYEENYTQGLSKEKKTAPTLLSRGSSGDDSDGEDDHVPIGKLKTKRLSEFNNNSTIDSRKRFCPLRQCEGKDVLSAPRFLRPAAIYDVRGG